MAYLSLNVCGLFVFLEQMKTPRGKAVDSVFTTWSGVVEKAEKLESVGWEEYGNVTNAERK